jgi:hypothetical protein
MVIPANRHIDNLDLSQLKAPLLNDYYGSSIQREDVAKIANEIMRRHLAKLPTDTGNLRSTARVVTRRSTGYQDGRWEAEYSVGGPRADYIVPLEDEHHYLDQVLREMGFRTGDIVAGPKGKVAAIDREPHVTLFHSTSAEAADSIVNEGFRQVFREESSPNYREANSGFAYFTNQPGGASQFGDRTVAADVPASALEEMYSENVFRVPIDRLSGIQFRHRGDEQ